MAQQEVIEFTVEDKKLIDAISKINAKLKALQQEAKGVGKSLGEGGGGKGTGGSTSGIFGSFNEKNIISTISKVSGAVTDFAANIGKLAAIMSGALYASTRLVNSGLSDMEKGLRDIIEEKALGPGMQKYVDAIRSVAGAFIDAGDAAKEAQIGKGLGASPEQLKAMSKVAASLALATGKPMVEVMNDLFAYMATGSAKKVRQYGALLETVDKVESGVKKTKDEHVKTQARLNAVMNDSNNILEKTGNLLAQPQTQMLNFLYELKESTKGLMNVLTGLAKVVGGVLLPIGAGLAAFALGPITGAIGSIIGLSLSGALAALSVFLIKSLGGEDKTKESFKAKMGAWSDVIMGQIYAFFQLLASGKAKITIPANAFKLAGVDPEEYRKQLENIAGGGAIGVNDFYEGFKAGFDIEKIKAAFGEGAERLFGGKKGENGSVLAQFGAAIGGTLSNIFILIGKHLPEIVSLLKGIFKIIINLFSRLPGFDEKPLVPFRSDTEIRDYIKEHKVSNITGVNLDSGTLIVSPYGVMYVPIPKINTKEQDDLYKAYEDELNRRNLQNSVINGKQSIYPELSMLGVGGPGRSIPPGIDVSPYQNESERAFAENAIAGKKTQVDVAAREPRQLSMPTTSMNTTLLSQIKEILEQSRNILQNLEAQNFMCRP